MAARHAGVARRRAAFTILELLVVAAIIAVLAAFLGGALIKKRSLRKVVKVQLRSLSMAIDAYRHELGAYPPDGGGTNDIPHPAWTSEFCMNEVLVFYLGRKHRRGANWYGPYIHFKETSLTDADGDGFQECRDPWRGLYLYAENASEATPTGVNPKSYDLVTPGPDGVLGGTMDPATGYVRAGTPAGKAQEKDNIANW